MVILAGIAVVIAVGPRFVYAARSAKAVAPAPSTADHAGFNRDESAALFVGVRDFTHRELSSVPYAADDAVDLAYLFVFDWRSRLVRADRVILALSGDPVKSESRRRLEMLQHAGASVRHADAADIVFFVKRQSALAGKNGILILSLATHGFVQRRPPLHPWLLLNPTFPGDDCLGPPPSRHRSPIASGPFSRVYRCLP